MKWTTFTIFCCLYLALFFALQRPPLPQQPYFFSRVVDLTDTRTLMTTAGSSSRVPPERLIVSAAVLTTLGHISLKDVAAYEKRHGQIASGAVLFARTERGGCISFSGASLKFLSAARNISGVATNAGCVQGIARVGPTAHLYELLNVPGIEALPPAGAMAVIAPSKTREASGAVRILALVQ